VHEHLQVCAQCQADVDFQRKLSALEIPCEAAVDVERGFAKLRPQLKAQPHATQHGGFGVIVRNLWRRGNRAWMPWALGVQFAAIAGLCIMLLQPERDGAYHGLGASGSVAGNVVVVFRPQTTEQELRRILRASGARVVDGPTVTDAYLLDVGADRQARALGLLRAESAVVLVESLESRSSH
jgi:hypothetical protein